MFFKKYSKDTEDSLKLLQKQNIKDRQDSFILFKGDIRGLQDSFKLFKKTPEASKIVSVRRP